MPTLQGYNDQRGDVYKVPNSTVPGTYILLAVALQSYYSSNAPSFQESKKFLDHSDFFLILSIW